LAQVSIHPKLADFSVKDTIKTKGSKKELGPPEPDGSASTGSGKHRSRCQFHLVGFACAVFRMLVRLFLFGLLFVFMYLLYLT
jgi:Flp pilus assembly protein TadB